MPSFPSGPLPEAEVDYVIAENSAIIPIEVKAGKSGTLKSLHLFFQEKRPPIGVRFNSDIPSLLTLEATLPDGQNLRYHLLSLHLYMVGQVRRLIRQCIKKDKSFSHRLQSYKSLLVDKLSCHCYLKY